MSESAIAAAEALEKQVNINQMRKMMIIARLCKKVYLFYTAEVVVDVFMVTALWSASSGLKLSFLSADSFWFQCIHLVELFAISMAIISGVSLIAFHVELCLCLTCMFDMLRELFHDVSTRESVNESIRIHQLLLTASELLRRAFTVPWFFFLINNLSVIIVSTYILIDLSFHVGFIIIIVSFFVVLCRACVLGERLSKSSSNIGSSVYHSDWVYKMSGLRGDLSLVILRSQKPALFTAGLFGKLNLAKVTTILNIWYKFVQALLNIHEK